MSRAHDFGTLLKQLRARVPGLTQARIAELAGYDPAVITRMARGGQDLTGPHARARVLQVIQALDEAGALRDLEDANALLAAANLSPLVEAREHEAGLIRRVLLHSGAHNKPGFASVAETKEPARRLLHEYARIWDRASNDVERVVVLAAAGELAMRHGHSALGIRLLARAALDDARVFVASAVASGAYRRQIRDARAAMTRVGHANAWAAGQLLTLDEARTWLAELARLMSAQKGDA